MSNLKDARERKSFHSAPRIELIMPHGISTVSASALHGSQSPNQTRGAKLSEMASFLTISPTWASPVCAGKVCTCLCKLFNHRSNACRRHHLHRFYEPGLGAGMHPRCSLQRQSCRPGNEISSVLGANPGPFVLRQQQGSVSRQAWTSSYM